MIVGHGIDLMSTSRIAASIARFGEHFLARIYTDHERAVADRRVKHASQMYTAFWAAKEATMKALGTGNRRGVHFRDIEVRHEPSGKPYIVLYGASRARAEVLGVDRIEVSLTHLKETAAASVLFESDRRKTSR
jgi:holo-[acyl-carrier protein] synthase